MHTELAKTKPKMSSLGKTYRHFTAKFSSKSLKNARFSRKQLTIYGIIFAAIGATLLYIALAAPATKVWDSQADFDATGNIKDKVTTNADGTFGLSQATGGSLPNIGLPSYEMHVEPYNYDPTNTPDKGQGFMWHAYKSPSSTSSTRTLRVNGAGNSAISPTTNYQDETWMTWQDYFPSANTKDSNAGGWN